MKYNWDKILVEEAVKNGDSYSDVLNILNIPVKGGNIKTLKRKIKGYNLDISHFTFGAKEKKDTENYIPVSEYFNTTKYITTSTLKAKLFKEGYKENKCEVCGITEWQGKPITIQLHHINGIHTDNRLENLQMLCPNCHSQTDSYCGSANEKRHYYCPDCGKEITKGAKYCTLCSQKHRQNKVISIEFTRENLVNKFIESDYNMSRMAKQLNISDNGLRKWFIKLGLLAKIEELKTCIINKEWETLPYPEVKLTKFESKYNKEEILNLLKEGDLTQAQIAEKIGCSLDLVKFYNKENPNKGKKYITNRCDKDGNILDTYSNRKSAAEWLIANNYTNLATKTVVNKLGLVFGTDSELFGFYWK